MSGMLEAKQVVEAVKGLHWRTSLEIHKLLKDNEDFSICYKEEEGPSPVKVQTFFFLVFFFWFGIGNEVLIF